MIAWPRLSKAIQEDQPDLEDAQAQDEVELESSQAMKQAGERLRASLREVIAGLPEQEEA